MNTPVDASYLADAVILLRYFEAKGEVRQAISVVKKRGSKHERTIREFRLDGGRHQRRRGAARLPRRADRRAGLRRTRRDAARREAAVSDSDAAARDRPACWSSRRPRRTRAITQALLSSRGHRGRDLRDASTRCVRELRARRRRDPDPRRSGVAARQRGAARRPRRAAAVVRSAGAGPHAPGRGLRRARRSGPDARQRDAARAPVRVATLLSAVRTALRARERQYQIRGHLAERARAEESLRLADQRKDEFLATLGHELRNPLAPLLTGLQLLKLAGAPGPGRRAGQRGHGAAGQPSRPAGRRPARGVAHHARRHRRAARAARSRVRRARRRSRPAGRSLEAAGHELDRRPARPSRSRSPATRCG